MDQVFRLQRRCIRVMSGLGWRDCCRNKFTELGLLTLPSLYILNCLKYIKANLHRFTYHSDIHDYPTRNCRDVLSGFHRLSRTRRGTDYHCVKFFNVLPENVRALPDELFYAKIKNYLL
nr:unnamed protein product [Callosobruchus analis]